MSTATIQATGVSSPDVSGNDPITFKGFVGLIASIVMAWVLVFGIGVGTAWILKSMNALDQGYKSPVPVFGAVIAVGCMLWATWAGVLSGEWKTRSQKTLGWAVWCTTVFWLWSVVILLLPWAFPGQEFLGEDLRRFESHLAVAETEVATPEVTSAVAVARAFRHAQSDGPLRFQIANTNGTNAPLQIAASRFNYSDCSRFVEAGVLTVGSGVSYVLTQVNGKPPSSESCQVGVFHDLVFQRQNEHGL